VPKSIPQPQIIGAKKELEQAISVVPIVQPKAKPKEVLTSETPFIREAKRFIPDLLKVKDAINSGTYVELGKSLNDYGLLLNSLPKAKGNAEFRLYLSLSSVQGKILDVQSAVDSSIRERFSDESMKILGRVRVASNRAIDEIANEAQELFKKYEPLP
jgi:hypothetical protein